MVVDGCSCASASFRNAPDWNRGAEAMRRSRSSERPSHRDFDFQLVGSAFVVCILRVLLGAAAAEDY